MFSIYENSPSAQHFIRFISARGIHQIKSAVYLSLALLSHSYVHDEISWTLSLSVNSRENFHKILVSVPLLYSVLAKFVIVPRKMFAFVRGSISPVQTVFTVSTIDPEGSYRSRRNRLMYNTCALRFRCPVSGWCWFGRSSIGQWKREKLETIDVGSYTFTPTMFCLILANAGI